MFHDEGSSSENTKEDFSNVSDPESAAGSLPRRLGRTAADQLLRLPGQGAPRMGQCQFLDPTSSWLISDIKANRVLH